MDIFNFSHFSLTILEKMRFFLFLHHKINGSKGVFWPKIPLNLTSEGLKYPPEVRDQHETCSTICGTRVQAILDQKNLTGLAGGVREGQNMVEDPRNGLKSIRGSWGDHLRSISGVFDPFRGL